MSQRITPFPLCRHIKTDGHICQSPARGRDRPQDHAPKPSRMNILASTPVDSRICADTPAQSKQNKPLLPKIEIKMPMFVAANH